MHYFGTPSGSLIISIHKLGVLQDFTITNRYVKESTASSSRTYIFINICSYENFFPTLIPSPCVRESGRVGLATAPREVIYLTFGASKKSNHAPSEREGIGRERGHILRFVPKIWYRKSSRSELQCVSLNYVLRKYRQLFGIWPDRGRGKGEKDATPPLRALPRSKDLARQDGSAPPAVFPPPCRASSRRGRPRR